MAKKEFTYTDLHEIMKIVAKHDDLYAGIPIPLGDDLPLVIEPTYPNAQGLMSLHKKVEYDEDAQIRNVFWSHRWKCHIYIYSKDGKIHWCFERKRCVDLLINTLQASDAWGLKQEKQAMETLEKLTSKRQFTHYLLTGMFLETSRRSNIAYLFRRLRPTLAMGSKNNLAALCMHPIAYYEDSWAGAMCPTDDVLAHLCLMRGDEHTYWKRCTQHPLTRPQAGLM